jgi:hypothetical protein
VLLGQSDRTPHGAVIDEYGAMVEWYICRGNRSTRRKPGQCHFVHHKSHMNWPGREPGPPRWEINNTDNCKCLFKYFIFYINFILSNATKIDFEPQKWNIYGEQQGTLSLTTKGTKQF